MCVYIYHKAHQFCSHRLSRCPVDGPACQHLLWRLLIWATLDSLQLWTPCRHDKVKEHAEFIIDETFGVPGVGTVIAGTVKKGVITTNANLMLGPDVGDGTFKPTAIKSIQYKRLPVTRVRIILLSFWYANWVRLTALLVETLVQVVLVSHGVCDRQWEKDTSI